MGIFYCTEGWSPNFLNHQPKFYSATFEYFYQVHSNSMNVLTRKVFKQVRNLFLCFTGQRKVSTDDNISGTKLYNDRNISKYLFSKIFSPWHLSYFIFFQKETLLKTLPSLQRNLVNALSWDMFKTSVFLSNC